MASQSTAAHVLHDQRRLANVLFCFYRGPQVDVSDGSPGAKEIDSKRR